MAGLRHLARSGLGGGSARPGKPRLLGEHASARRDRLETDRWIGGLPECLRDETIDLLVNNAGAYFERWGKNPIGSIRYDDGEETFRVNTLGPMRVAETWLAQIARGDRPIGLGITSHMGSIAVIDAPRDHA